MTNDDQPRRLSRRSESLVWLMIVAMMVYPVPPVIWALPSGESVSQGQVEFLREANRLVVNQASDKAIVNYQAFNISAGNTVQFNQPGSSAAILNRVVGSGSSTIAGALLANGRVYLINPAGILFSPSASVNVGALVASAMNMSDEDFMAGRLRFSGGGGSVVNQGVINAASVLLVGRNVENAGAINAGEVILAAGEQSVEIDRVEGGLVRVIIDGLVDEGETGLSGDDASVPSNPLSDETSGDDVVSGTPDDDAPQAGSVVNTGTIAAQAEIGGLVQLSGNTIEQAGVIDASGIGGGNISFIAGDSVMLGVNNLTLATAPAEGLGGTIQIQGDRVGVMGGVIDASGATGGGEILIGGDFGGREDRVERATATVIAPDAVIRADALEEGDGGNIAIWGTDVVRFLGSASARGGSGGGDGGFVEVSGLGEVDVRGLVDTRAPAGQAGAFLIDPTDLEIGNFADSGVADPGTWFEPSGFPSRLSWQTITNNLASGSVIVQTVTGHDAGQPGNISVVNGVTYDSGNTLKLDAAGSVIVDATIENTGDGTLYLRAQHDIEQFAEVSVASLMLEAVTGDIRFSADNTIGMVAAFAGGAVRVENVGDLRVGSVTDATTGNAMLGIQADGNIMLESFTGGVAIEENIESAGGFISIQAEGDINQSANLSSGSTIDLEARAGSITMAAGARTQTTDANIRYRAGVGPNVNSDIRVSTIDAGTALVSIWASRNIINNEPGAVNITASGLRLVAGGDAGSGSGALSASVDELAADVGSGLYLENNTGITLDEVGPVSVYFGLSDLSVLEFTDPALSGIRTDADLSLVANSGDINVATLLEVDGNALLNARGGSLTLNTVLNGGGNISLSALNDLIQNASISAGGSLAVQSTSGSVIMAPGTQGSTASGGGIRYAAGQNIEITSLSTSGDATLQAGGTISGSGQITADELTASSGGAITLNTRVNTLTATNATGNISISEADAITLANLAAAGGSVYLVSGGDITALQVHAAQTASLFAVNGGITDVTGSTVTATETRLIAGNGSIGSGANAFNTSSDRLLLIATNGSIYVVEANGASLLGASASGDIDVAATLGDLAIDGSTSAGMDLLLQAWAGNLALNAETTAGGDATLQAGGTISGSGQVTADELTASAGGAITLNTAVNSLTATNATGNISISEADAITLANLTAAGGSVYLVSGGDITALQVHAAQTASLFAVNGGIADGTDSTVTATETRLIAGNGSIGSGANAFNTSSDRLLLIATNGSIYVVEANGASLLGASASGDIDVTATSGDLAIDGSTSAGMDLLLQAWAGNLALNAETTAGGDATLQAGGTISGSGQITADELTASSGGAITLDTRVNTLTATNATGNISISEADAITLANLAAAGGSVYLVSGGDITALQVSAAQTASLFAVNGGIADGTDSTVNATETRLIAGNGSIGSGANAFNTSSDRLLLIATNGSIYVVEANGASLLGASASGDIDVTATLGDLAIDGSTAAGLDLLLQAWAGNLALNAETTAGGDATLQAGGTISGSGQVTADELTASSGGAITLNTRISTLTATNATGNISISEADAITLANLAAAGGSVYLVSGGDITALQVSAAQTASLFAVNGGITDVTESTVTATETRLIAGNGSIGSLANAFNTSSDRLLLIATNGSIYVVEANGASLLGASASGDIDVTATSGDLAIDGSTSAGMDLLLQAWTGNLALNADTTAGGDATLQAGGTISGSGQATADELTVSSGGAITLNTTVNSLTATNATGNISISEADAITLANIATEDGALRVVAGGDITVNNVSMLNELEVSAGGFFAGNIFDIEGAVSVTAVGDVSFTSLQSGGDFQLDSGDSFTFDALSGGRVDVRVDGDVNAGALNASELIVVAGGSILQRSGLLAANSVDVVVGGDVGSLDARVIIRSGMVQGVMAGGSIFVQLAPLAGDTIALGLIEAGSNFDVLVPGPITLVDNNDGALNLRAESTSLIDAYQIGTLADALEIEIRNGVLRVTSRDVSGTETPDDFVFVHLDGTIGGEGKPVQYFDPADDLINGFVIFNGQVIDGKPRPEPPEPPEPPKPPEPPEPPEPRPPRPVPPLPGVDLAELIKTLGLGGSPFFTSSEIAAASHQKATRLALIKEVRVASSLPGDGGGEDEAIFTPQQRGGEFKQRVLPLDGVFSSESSKAKVSTRGLDDAEGSLFEREAVFQPASGATTTREKNPPASIPTTQDEDTEQKDETMVLESEPVGPDTSVAIEPAMPVTPLPEEELPIEGDILPESKPVEEPMIYEEDIPPSDSALPEDADSPDLPSEAPVDPEALDALFEDWREESGTPDNLQPEIPVAPEALDALFDDWQKASGLPGESEPVKPTESAPPEQPVSDEEMDHLLREWEGTPGPVEKSPDPNAPLPRTSKPVTGEEMDRMLRDWENASRPLDTKPDNYRPQPLPDKPVTEEQVDALLRDWEREVGGTKPKPAKKPVQPALTVRPAVSEEQLDAMLEEWGTASGQGDESPPPVRPTAAAPAMPVRHIAPEDLDKLLRDWEGEPDITARDLDDLLNTWAAAQQD